jgi:Glycosyl transferase family 2
MAVDHPQNPTLLPENPEPTEAVLLQASAFGAAAAALPTSRGVVVVVVPAHNEEAEIRQTLESLFRRTRRPDRIVVVADNCTYANVEIAQSMGVEVLKTIGNESKKAGALIQGWRDEWQTRALAAESQRVLIELRMLRFIWDAPAIREAPAGL